MKDQPADLDTYSGLVLFTAPWVTVAPHVAALIAEHAPQQPLVHIDVEATPHIAEQHTIHSLPTILLLHNGREQSRHLGALGPHELTALLHTGR